jgi:nucleoside-diphosphate-sugar epimerase
MARVLVTGATGFIGNHVIAKLLDQGIEVIATSSDYRKAQNFSWFSKVEYCPLNLKDFHPSVNYYEFFHRPDKIIHLAWEGLPNYKSLFHFEENLPAHYYFLKNLVQNGLTDITVTGTCFEYGMQEGCLNETYDTKPVTAYGLAKDTLRKFLQELQKQIPFYLKWPRLFYLYGSGQHPNSILPQLEKALEKGDQHFNMSGGRQLRDYLDVEKAASYLVQISLQTATTGVINCSSGSPVSVLQLVEDYLKKQNKKIHLNTGYYPYPDYEPMEFWGDNSILIKTITNE